MTKNQILSYVLKTPENTNPQVLMSMLKILLFASMAELSMVGVQKKVMMQ